MNSQILLTGGNGFLGTVIKEFYEKDLFLQLLGRSKDALYKFDLTEKIPCFENRFDFVIHCAGKAHVKENKKNSELFNKVNFIGTVNLLNALEKNPPVSFVFISTVAVYGLTESINVDEDHNLQANDAYGKSKILAESFIIEWCKNHNVKYTILRLPLVVGQNPPGNLRSMINGIRRGYYVNIAGGKARRSMVLATDVAKFIFKAGEVGGIYNLTDGFHPNYFELSQVLANRLGKYKIKNVPYGLAKFLTILGLFLGKYAPLNSEKLKKMTSTLTFDDSKARSSFGWNPKPVLQECKELNLINDSDL